MSGRLDVRPDTGYIAMAEHRVLFVQLDCSKPGSSGSPHVDEQNNIEFDVLRPAVQFLADLAKMSGSEPGRFPAQGVEAIMNCIDEMRGVPVFQESGLTVESATAPGRSMHNAANFGPTALGLQRGGLPAGRRALTTTCHPR